ncbi:MAG: pimeloyl-ACP methyl ester carboxylesterase [Cryomorphaceae bacterium]|jgi:pimeloyl-ACP methyl ester carboxylesterase
MKSKKLDIRGLDYHIQEWGDSSNPTLVLLHGWMDCGGSYKFVAEHLAEQFHIVAPDLRGFGETEHSKGYWFPDYFADLEKVLDHYVPNQPANLVGHSMGGNIVLMYAGINPQRVGRVMSLESLGAMETKSSEAADKYRRWMREILSDEPVKIYPNEMMFLRSIHKGNPSLSDDMISELAGLWGTPVGEDGAMRLKHDHAHRYTNPVRYNFEDTLALWREITAKVAVVMAAESRMYQHYEQIGRVEQALSVLKVSEQNYSLIENCEHMLHLEQPQLTADAIREFFS